MPDVVRRPPAFRVRVAVADRLTLCREGLVSLLSGYPHVTVVGSIGSVCDVIEMCKDAQPDVLVLCSGIAEEMTRAQFEALAKQAPRSKLVLLVDEYAHLTSHKFPPGTRGVLRRDDTVERLLKAVSVVASGGTWDVEECIPPAIPNTRRRRSGLTERESEIAVLVAQGLSNREIALKLELSEQSVKNFVSRILKKLGLNNRVQIALRCLTN